MLKFKHAWDQELRNWLKGANQAYVNQFNDNAILRAIADAKSGFSAYQWCNNFIDIAMDPFNPKVVTIEQGTHQPEANKGGGFKLHFTGRDNAGYAFHFYVQQQPNGTLRVTEMSYVDGALRKFNRA